MSNQDDFDPPKSDPSLSEALANLQDIRGVMAAGSLFQGFGPAVIAATGVFSFLLTLLQGWFPELLARNGEHILLVWIGLAILCVLMIGAEMVARSRRHHGGMADAMILKAIEQYIHVGFAGAAIGFVFWRFSPETLWALPGLWQVLVGIGIFASARTLPRTMLFVGGWYFLVGIIILSLMSGTKMITPLMMGLPFTIGQAFMAIILYTAKEISND